MKMKRALSAILALSALTGLILFGSVLIFFADEEDDSLTALMS
jgi:hypothetical protein